MTQYFISVTQFDQKYNDLGHFGKDRSACSIFSLQTVQQFMKNGYIDEANHSNNLDNAINNHIQFQIKGHITFDKLLSYCTLDKQTDVTSVELIKENIIGYDNIFKEEHHNKRYSIIFLKNNKFFVVMYNPATTYDKEGYYIRDCHESHQYNFTNRADLIAYLGQTYQFDKAINLSGFTIDEYSNIEYKVVEENLEFNKSTGNKNNSQQTVANSDADFMMALKLQEQEYI